MGLNFNILDDPNFQYIRSKLESSPYHLSFLNERFAVGDLDAWRSEARQYIQERLMFSPDPVPLNEEIVEEEDFGDYIRQKVYFDSFPGCRVPAYLLIPKNLQEPAPAMIVLHDHGGMLYWGKEKVVEHKDGHEVLEKFIDECYDGKPPASELAKRGYVTLVIDCLFFGERKLKLEAIPEFQERLNQHEFESPAYIREYNNIESGIVEGEVCKALIYSGWTSAGLRIHDDRRSIDYLLSRPEVDPNRIGCIGLSMGGHRSAWLSAMDDRIKCAVVVCWMALHQDMVEHRISNIHWMWAVPGLHDAMDYPDVAALSAPKPLMIIHGSRDRLFPHQTGEKAMKIIEQVYEKAGCREQLLPKLYDSDHAFNLEMQADAYTWLDEQMSKLKNNA